MNAVLKVFHRLLDELEAAKVPYMVMGGWAVQVWGRPRPTYDVDFTLSLSDADLCAFLQVLADRGMIVDEAFLKGFQDRLAGFTKVQVSVFEFPDPIRVDLFLARNPYQVTAFKRRREVVLFKRKIWVMAPEDLILHKLVAGRHKDLAAIEDILMVQGGSDRLDKEYLWQWASTLGVRDALEKVLAG
jgi:hypothetical protein